jgi:cation diffusion facilitator CzcD-associated flavoprotein CzcO
MSSLQEGEVRAGAPVQKRALIIGAGPAGLTAAQTSP